MSTGETASSAGCCWPWKRPRRRRARNGSSSGPHATRENAFGLISAQIQLVDPATVPVEERIPGDPLPVRAVVSAGGDAFGVLTGTLQATRSWERADQNLLELYASQVGAALRNAQLYAQVEAQNTQLRSLSEAKDDFLRGVSHNLQTPLARIKASAEGLAVAGTGGQPAPARADEPIRGSRSSRNRLTGSRGWSPSCCW